MLGSLPTDRACLLVDINMPEMSGVQLCHALEAKGIKLPTILITGHRTENAGSYAEETGAIAILFKPLEAAELFNTIEIALKRGVV